MRKASTFVVAMLMAIALYFTLFWGFDALTGSHLADLRA